MLAPLAFGESVMGETDDGRKPIRLEADLDTA